MKKLFIAALLAVTVAGSAFAADVKNVNANVLESFTLDFKGASDVQWTVTAEYAKAIFILDKVRMEAFFNLDGKMIGTSRGICIDHLSTNAKRAFAKKYQDYTIKEAILFEGTDETAYYISAENEKETVILKVDESDRVSIFKQTKK